jgi:hypothetical protein
VWVGCAPPRPPPPTRPPATLLVAEPHYRATDGRPPWEAALRFLRDRAALVAAGALSPDAAACPAGARVVCAGVAAPDLARTAGRVGSVAGVDMAAFDAAAAPARRTGGRWLCPCRSIETQCGEVQEVTARAVVSGGGGLAALADFAALGCGLLPPRLDGRAVLASAGTDDSDPCAIDALALWVEYAGAAGAAPSPSSSSLPSSPSSPFVPAWTSGNSPALFLLPAPLAVPRPPGGLAVTLDLDVTADAGLGGGLAVRAEVGVGQ